MIIDRTNSIESLLDGTKEVTDSAYDKADSLNKYFDSKIEPHLGKYGNVAKFAAELVPGVAEYNAIKEGDWKGFAIAAGIDVGAIAVGAVSAGAGYASIKGSSAVARAGVKAATREIAEAGVKGTAKEIAEFSAKKVVKETVDAGTETVARRTVDEGVERVTKEMADEGVEIVQKPHKVNESLLRSPEKTDGYYTSLEDRVKCTNLEGERGFWDGERGRSVFYPSDNKIKETLKKYGLKGIEYIDGEADFSRVATETVKIDNMTVERLGKGGNFDQANTKLAEKFNAIEKDGLTNWDAAKVEQYRKANNLTWHERCDRGTMDLVQTEIHDYFKHSGGVAECKVRDGAGGRFDE